MKGRRSSDQNYAFGYPCEFLGNQDGAPNLFFMLTLARGLKPGSKATVERVLQNNSFFAHHENILIAMLRDESEEARRRAVLFIRYGND